MEFPSFGVDPFLTTSALPWLTKWATFSYGGVETDTDFCLDSRVSPPVVTDILPSYNYAWNTTTSGLAFTSSGVGLSSVRLGLILNTNAIRGRTDFVVTVDDVYPTRDDNGDGVLCSSADDGSRSCDITVSSFRDVPLLAPGRKPATGTLAFAVKNAMIPPTYIPHNISGTYAARFAWIPVDVSSGTASTGCNATSASVTGVSNYSWTDDNAITLDSIAGFMPTYFACLPESKPPVIPAKGSEKN